MTEKTKKTEKGSFGVILGDFKKKQNSNIPTMPKNLSPSSKHWWRKLMNVIDQSVLIPADGIALTLLCDVLSEYERILDQSRNAESIYRNGF
jgi:phage terminase small subunit